MWNSKKSPLPNVLIVQSDNGDVFIVEDVKSKPLVDKILNEEKTSTSTTRKSASESKLRDHMSEPEK